MWIMISRPREIDRLHPRPHHKYRGWEVSSTTLYRAIGPAIDQTGGQFTLAMGRKQWELNRRQPVVPFLTSRRRSKISNYHWKGGVQSVIWRQDHVHPPIPKVYTLEEQYTIIYIHLPFSNYFKYI